MSELIANSSIRPAQPLTTRPEFSLQFPPSTEWVESFVPLREVVQAIGEYGIKWNTWIAAHTNEESPMVDPAIIRLAVVAAVEEMPQQFATDAHQIVARTMNGDYPEFRISQTAWEHANQTLTSLKNEHAYDPNFLDDLKARRMEALDLFHTLQKQK